MNESYIFFVTTHVIIAQYNTSNNSLFGEGSEYETMSGNIRQESGSSQSSSMLIHYPVGYSVSGGKGRGKGKGKGRGN